MSKVPPDPPLIEMKQEPEDESSTEGSSGSMTDSDDSEDLENSRKIQEFQEKVSYCFDSSFKKVIHDYVIDIILYYKCISFFILNTIISMNPCSVSQEMISRFTIIFLDSIARNNSILYSYIFCS